MPNENEVYETLIDTHKQVISGVVDPISINHLYHLQSSVDLAGGVLSLINGIINLNNGLQAMKQIRKQIPESLGDRSHYESIKPIIMERIKKAEEELKDCMEESKKIPWDSNSSALLVKSELIKSYRQSMSDIKDLLISLVNA